MFDSMDHRNERDVRLEKSKIYKQMLDNQVYLNQQYRKKEEERINASYPSQQKAKARSKEKEARQLSRPTKSKTKKQQYFYQLPRHFPVLHDKNTHYEGQSNFVPIVNLHRVKKRINRIRTELITEQIPEDYQSSDEEIDDILSELQTLNKEIARSKKQMKQKRMSNFGASARRQRRETQSREPSRQAQNVQQEQGNIRNRVNKASPPRSLGRNQRHNTVNFQFPQPSTLNSQQARRYNFSSFPQTPKQEQLQASTYRTLQNPHSHSLSKQDASLSSIEIERQRERFIQILRKVKNRGQSLFIKLSKFPKDK